MVECISIYCILNQLKNINTYQRSLEALIKKQNRSPNKLSNCALFKCASSNMRAVIDDKKMSCRQERWKIHKIFCPISFSEEINVPSFLCPTFPLKVSTLRRMVGDFQRDSPMRKTLGDEWGTDALGFTILRRCFFSVVFVELQQVLFFKRRHAANMG